MSDRLPDEQENAYVVFCEQKVVLFGYATPSEMRKERPTLKRVRMAIYWSAETRGSIGLAAIGPQAFSRISPAAPQHTIQTRVEGFCLCTKEAVDSWEKGPWT